LGVMAARHQWDALHKARALFLAGEPNIGLRHVKSGHGHGAGVKTEPYALRLTHCALRIAKSEFRDARTAPDASAVGAGAGAGAGAGDRPARCALRNFISSGQQGTHQTQISEGAASAFLRHGVSVTCTDAPGSPRPCVRRASAPSAKALGSWRHLGIECGHAKLAHRSQPVVKCLKAPAVHLRPHFVCGGSDNPAATLDQRRRYRRWVLLEFLPQSVIKEHP
jgi:hypothetical protein